MQEVKDYLQTTSESVFPLPELKDVYTGTVNLPEDLNKEAIDQNIRDNIATLKEYEKRVSTSYLDMWRLSSNGLLA